jgi:hypothetical protein
MTYAFFPVSGVFYACVAWAYLYYTIWIARMNAYVKRADKADRWCIGTYAARRSILARENRRVYNQTLRNVVFDHDVLPFPTPVSNIVAMYADADSNS